MIWKFKEDQYQDVDHKKNWSSDDELEESIYTHPGTWMQFIHRSFISISFGLCTHRTSREDDLQKFWRESRSQQIRTNWQGRRIAQLIFSNSDLHLRSYDITILEIGKLESAHGIILWKFCKQHLMRLLVVVAWIQQRNFLIDQVANKSSGRREFL
jgi:hypothetical protein